MSFFDRVADAAAEAAYDVDVALSTQMHRREHRKFKECKVSEQRDFERAQKLQEEERDELLAYKLGEREKKEEHDRISAERDQKAAEDSYNEYMAEAQAEIDSGNPVEIDTALLIAQLIAPLLLKNAATV